MPSPQLEGKKMNYIIAVAVSFLASVVGAICGIGGGVIIKPVLDATGIMPVNTISFMSGCTVLSMSIVSVVKKMKANKNTETEFNVVTATELAVGAVIGGILGKTIYQHIIQGLSDVQHVGAVQATVLLLITAGTLLYTIYKKRIITYHIKSVAACVLTGSVLGIMSSFLGIGGGPINLVVLFFLFSMGTKQAASYSLYIIMFSQLASLFSSVVTGTVPEFSPFMIGIMVACGIAGGFVGAIINRKIGEETVDKLFMALMVVIIIINAFNIIKYT